MDMNLLPLLEYTREEFAELLAGWGIPSFRVGQIRRWIFSRKTFSFSQMSDLSKDLRARLTASFCDRQRDNAESSATAAQDACDAEDSILQGTLVAKSISDDGSEKLLIEWRDGRRVECVLLRDDRSHRTACVSSQVGCAMGCAFCASGLGGFERNLTRGEILEQILRLNALLPKEERLTHIVAMGTGEPTLNLDALLGALKEATAEDGLDIGNRKATISTVGIPAGIRRLADAKTQFKLAVSLHASNDRTRDLIMPQNKVHPIREVVAAADYFFRTTGRRVTFEYILLSGVNDSPKDAKELAALLRDKTAIVNVIPYNPVPELPFKTPSTSTIKRFIQTLELEGVQVKARFRKGDKINAACGQLRWSMRETERRGKDED